jgi:hypothetical protein
MLDYIFVDYLDYILRYFLFIPIGVILVYVIYMAVYGTNKVVRGFLIFSILASILAFLFVTNYPRQQLIGEGIHYDCNRRIEYEAQNIVAAINSYLAVPERTQTPSISDLVNSGDYSLENIDLKRRDKLYKESEFSIKILGDVSEILIVLSCKKGKCPFYRWKCPRLFKGKFYVYKMSNGGGMWVDSYEDI